MTIASLEDRIAEYFRAQAPGVVAVYLFGSEARGDARPGSDIDIAILLDKSPPKTMDALRIGLQGDLEDALGRPVDLVVMNGAPVDLVHRVMRDGHLLRDCDPSRRIRFEVRARNDYFDLLPILREYRKQERASR